jgi:hypothetical protein
MNDKDLLQKRVEETLASLDTVQRAQANPFLYTRIAAKLEEEEHTAWYIAARWLTRPWVTVAALLVVLFMNAAVLLPGSEADLAVQDDTQQLATEYTMASTADETLYSLTNEEQP